MKKHRPKEIAYQNEKVLRWAYELINQIEESRQTYSDFQEEF